jgi:hypothetical protein
VQHKLSKKKKEKKEPATVAFTIKQQILQMVMANLAETFSVYLQ